MYWLIYQAVLTIHVLLGIVWVGGILFVGWGVFPVSKKMDYRSRQHFLIALMKWIHHKFSAIGLGVIATGILLGSVLGPVKSWESALHTSYGNHFLYALLLGAMTLLWGIFVSYRYSMRALTHDTLWGMACEGYPRLLNNSMRKVTLISGVEVAGFLGLLAIMLSF